MQLPGLYPADGTQRYTLPNTAVQSVQSSNPLLLPQYYTPLNSQSTLNRSSVSAKINPLPDYTATQLYEHNHFHHAINADTQLLKTPQIRPDDILNRRGITKAGLKDYLGAFQDYSQALAVNPYFFKPYINRGNLWVFLGGFAAKHGRVADANHHYAMALQDYQQAIRLNPLSTIAYENRGELYATMGRSQEALQDKALALHLEIQKTPAKSTAFQNIDYAPRIGLVLANDDYILPKDDLNGGTTQDALAIAKTLKADRFDVLTGYNMNGVQMRMRIEEFIHKLHNTPQAVAVVYYSGHGGSIKGNNYFLPVDFQGNINSQFVNTAVSVDYLLDKLKTVPNQLNIILVDACRNPLDENAVANKEQPERMEVKPSPLVLSNTWIEYATRPSKRAYQQNNQGLFTKYFLQYMRQPGLSLKETSLRTSYGLARDPEAQRHGQQSSTETNTAVTEPMAKNFHFTPV
jgi:hypothetical protein